MQVKGTAVRSILVALERTYGAEALATVMAALPAEVRAQAQTLVPSAWHPIQLSAELHSAIRKTLGQGSVLVNYRIGLEAAKVDFGGVYRAVLWTMDCESALRRVERVWRQYNSQGEARWERLEPGDGVLCVSGVSGYHLGMWTAIAGRSEGVVRLCGATSAHAEVIRWDATSCTIHLKWTP